MFFELRAWEKMVVAAGALLALSTFYMYVSGIHFLAGLQGEGRRIGEIDRAEGEVRRELAAEDEFTPISKGEGVFNGDLIFTSPTARAQVELEDGSQLTVEPGSMVRLEFDRGFRLPGISRALSVNVVTGAVASKPGKSHVRLLDRGRAQAEGALSVKASVVPFVPPPPRPVPEAEVV